MMLKRDHRHSKRLLCWIALLFVVSATTCWKVIGNLDPSAWNAREHHGGRSTTEVEETPALLEKNGVTMSKGTISPAKDNRTMTTKKEKRKEEEEEKEKKKEKNEKEQKKEEKQLKKKKKEEEREEKEKKEKEKKKEKYTEEKKEEEEEEKKQAETATIDASPTLSAAFQQGSESNLPLVYQDRGKKCSIVLGHCLAVGCDGAVYSATEYCTMTMSLQDSATQGYGKTTSTTVAVKFYKNLTHIVESRWLNETELRHSIEQVSRRGSSSSGENNDDDARDHVAYPYASVLIPAAHLGHDTGDCTVADDDDDENCGRLHSFLWQRQPMALVPGSVLPFTDDWTLRDAKKSPDAIANAPSIFHGVSKGFLTLYRARVTHCDMRTTHVVIIPHHHHHRKSKYTGRIIDFSRAEVCPDCPVGFKLQLLHFGAMILDFCSPIIEDEKHSSPVWEFDDNP